MESSEEIEVAKKCYKYKERLLGSLNISYNESNSMFMFWNKYQIFVHEDINLEETAKSFVPEFQIQQVLVSNNYLTCLDINGNVHIASLKFKNATQKIIKASFQPRANRMLHCIQYSPNTALFLKHDSESYFLILHRMNADFQIAKETVLKLEPEEMAPKTCQEKCLLYSKALSQSDFEDVKQKFRAKDSLWKDSSIVLVSLDQRNVYGCLYSPKTNEQEIRLVKLYTSPSEICNISIPETGNLSLVIGLKCGTFIRQVLRSLKEEQDTLHVNTAIHKFLALKENDAALYTDGISMWKIEDAFSKTDSKFRKLFVKQPKDFVKVGDRIICTTYSNMIYNFAINSKEIYENVENEDFCSADKLLRNSDCIQKIMREIEKNKDLIKNVGEENKHITALSLAKRPDIMDKVILNDTIVYDCYNNVLTDNNNSEITLVEDLYKYMEPETFMLLVKLSATSMQQTLNEVLSNLLADIKIHITLSSENKMLKNTTIKLTEPLKKVHVLLPLQSKNMLVSTEIRVNIKLILNLPGCMDEKEVVWTVLYAKETVLHSEHFIETPKNSKINMLKEPHEKIEDLILKTAINQHGTLFEFTVQPKSNANEWSLYIKLPANFKEFLTKEDYYTNHFSQQKAAFIHKNLSSEDFLKSKHKLLFKIGIEKVRLEIINDDFCSPLLKVSCGNIKIAFNMRNFLANLVYSDFKDCKAKEFIDYSLYTTTENLQKAIKESLSNESQEDLLLLAEQFQKNVIGAFTI